MATDVAVWLCMPDKEQTMGKENQYPAKVLQFGEGNFLRAFIDWMIEGMNQKAGFSGSVLLGKTIPGPFHPAFEKQDYAYNLVIRGKDGESIINDRHTIRCIGGNLNAYEDFDTYLQAASNPDLQIIVSNTTEAGIAYNESDQASDRPAPSYPAKLTQFLRARFLALQGRAGSGMFIMPCELIEKNGQTLKRYVLQHAERWYHDAGFTAWLDKQCTWFDTLVDRIVPGHDKDERARCLQETGFDDELIVVTEPYHLFVIQGDEREDILPFRKAGFNVVWTSDLTPYRTMKVRILNGGHTFMTMIGMNLGVQTVAECLKHPLLGKALDRFYTSEVFPLMPFSQRELADYHATILDRFANPFVEHKLESIALNSVSKWISRILPGMQDYVAQFKQAPVWASFGLAALVHRYLYQDGIQDDAPVIAAFKAIGEQKLEPQACVAAVFASKAIWIQNAVVPPEVQQLVALLFGQIREKGFSTAMEALIK